MGTTLRSAKLKWSRKEGRIAEMNFSDGKFFSMKSMHATQI
jgi:hypothetical protein